AERAERGPEPVRESVNDEEILRTLAEHAETPVKGVPHAGAAPEPDSAFQEEDTPLPPPAIDEASDAISSNGASYSEAAGMVESFDGPEPPSARPASKPAPLLTIRPTAERPAVSGEAVVAIEHPVEGNRSRFMLLGGMGLAVALAAIAILGG